MSKRLLAATVMWFALVAVIAPVAATAAGRAKPAIVAEGLPEQCVVPPQVLNLPQSSASRLLTLLGCRVRILHQSSSVKHGRVVAVAGGLRSWPYGHIVTIVVSSGD